METFELAPDFILKDTNDKVVRLSQFRGEKFVLLEFLRGFV